MMSYPFVSEIEVICLTETRVRSDIPLPAPPNMHAAFSNSDHGCVVFSTDEQRSIFTMNDVVEAVGVVVGTYVVVCVYIPPNKPWREVENILISLLSICISVKQSEACNSLVIVGDFNIPSYSNSHQINELFAKYGLRQIVKQSTHKQGSILDLFFTDKENGSAIVHPVFFSDHSMVISSLSTKTD